MPAPSLLTGLDPQALLGLSAQDTEAGQSEWQPPSLEEVATLFPQWEVRRLLGRGGMGAVYEMRQPELDRLVAVKLLPIEASRDEHQVERFRREARTLAKLKHPGIVALLEAGITPAGHFFFVMEHVDGAPLSSLIAAGRLDTARALEITRQVCEALAYAHAQGVVHRDVKPANVLMDSQGRAKVADFGLARHEHAPAAGALDVSRTGQFMGTAAYAAPEQVRDAAHVDHRADIYALGVLLYEMLTGDLPRGVFQPPSRRSGTDERLDDVVRRALQERPEDRYQAAADLQKDITRAARKPVSSMFWFAAAVVLVVGSAAWFWRPWEMKQVVIPAPAPPAMMATPQQPAPLPTAVAKTEPPVPPPPPAATTPQVRVWSLEDVVPALMPPTELTRQPWKDAVLTSIGGAVLHPDGSISIWHERAPNAIQRPGLHATAIACSGDDVFALDIEGHLIRLGDSKRLAEGLQAIFSFSRPGTLPVLTSAGELVLLDITSGTRKPLPKPPGAISRLTMLEGEVLWCLLESSDFLVLQGDAYVKPKDATMQRAADFFAGNGFTAVLDENNRCTLQGAKVPEGRQVFRLPTNTKNLRVGPGMRMAAW